MENELSLSISPILLLDVFEMAILGKHHIEDALYLNDVSGGSLISDRTKDQEFRFFERVIAADRNDY
jgi:hypothetical protein